MLMRVTPPACRAASFSRVMVSGRPASTVNSEHREKSNCSRIFPQRAASWGAESVVGVPPPIYTAQRVSPSALVTCAVFSSSNRSNAQ